MNTSTTCIAHYIFACSLDTKYGDIIIIPSQLIYLPVIETGSR